MSEVTKHMPAQMVLGDSARQLGGPGEEPPHMNALGRIGLSVADEGPEGDNKDREMDFKAIVQAPASAPKLIS